MRPPWVIRWALSAVAFIVVVDLSVVAIALPAIQQDLGFSVAGVQWVMTGYALAQGGLLLVAGRLADRFGRHRVLTVGLALFGLCSLLAAASTSAGTLVAARVLQGVGGAAMLPSALALLSSVAEPAERARSLALFSAMSGTGFVVGVIAGGALTQYVGWRAVMLLSVPVAAALIPILHRALPDPPAIQPGRALDTSGSVTLTLGLTALILGLLRIEPDGITAPAVWGSLGVSALLLGAFVRIERRSPEPMLPLAALRQPTLAAANAANTLKSAVGMAQLYVLTLFLQHVAGASPVQAGLAFVPMAAASVAGATIAGRCQSRLGGVRGTATIGCVLLLGGLAVLAVQLGPTAHLLGVVAAMIVIELGFMIAEVPLNLAAATALPAQRGLAAGVLNTTTELGNALGLGLTAAVVGLRRSTLEHLPEAEALSGGLRWGLVVGIGAVVLAAGIVVLGLRDAAAGPAAEPGAGPYD